MKEMQEYLQKVIRDGRLAGAYPSAAVSIGVKGSVLAEAYTGEAPLPGDSAVNEHTCYDIASLSKILGPTMIVLRAVENKEISLDETIGDFLPNVPADKREISVRMILTHTGGFHFGLRLDHHHVRAEDALSFILNYPLAETPGEKPIYSCTAFIVLGKMLEQRFGKPLKDLAQERVFNPLGMNETTYSPKRKCICAATEIDPATGTPCIGFVHDENARLLGGNSGNAGVFMTMHDGIIFAKMLADMGGNYLSRGIMEEAIRNYTPGQDNHRGLGFQLAGTPGCFMGDVLPRRCFGHTGFTGISLVVDPGTGFWVLIMSNRIYPVRTNELLFPLRIRIHGEAWNLAKKLHLLESHSRARTYVHNSQ